MHGRHSSSCSSVRAVWMDQYVRSCSWHVVIIMFIKLASSVLGFIAVIVRVRHRDRSATGRRISAAGSSTWSRSDVTKSYTSVSGHFPSPHIPPDISLVCHCLNENKRDGDKTTTYERAFFVAGPSTAWNSLPSDIRTALKLQGHFRKPSGISLFTFIWNNCFATYE